MKTLMLIVLAFIDRLVYVLALSGHSDEMQMR